MDKVSKIYGINPVKPLEEVKRARKQINEKGKSNSDKIQLSSFAKELQVAFSELQNITEVRMEKVQQLKKEIEAGTYNPDLKAVAFKLIRSGVLFKGFKGEE